MSLNTWVQYSDTPSFSEDRRLRLIEVPWHGRNLTSQKLDYVSTKAVPNPTGVYGISPLPYCRRTGNFHLEFTTLITRSNECRIIPNSKTLLATRSSAMTPRLRIWGACRALAIRSRPAAPRTEPFINTASRLRWYSDQNNSQQPPKPIESSNKLENAPKEENAEVGYVFCELGELKELIELGGLGECCRQRYRLFGRCDS
jgi:hypothetical protein